MGSLDFFYSIDKKYDNETKLVVTHNGPNVKVELHWNSTYFVAHVTKEQIEDLKAVYSANTDELLVMYLLYHNIPESYDRNQMMLDLYESKNVQQIYK